jgi:RNA polymerase sigma-70 factor (ECF subfamily)
VSTPITRFLPLNLCDSTLSRRNTGTPRVVRIRVRHKTFGVDLEARQFNYLYRNYRAAVFAVAKGIVLDDGLAEDITQEVFVRLNREENVEYPYAWLRRVARRLALNGERDRKRRAEILQENDAGWLDEPEASVAEALAAYDLSEKLREEVSTWPEEFHETAYRLLRGDRPNEIQEALKLNSGTVSSRIHRIRKRFEIFLESQKQGA